MKTKNDYRINVIYSRVSIPAQKDYLGIQTQKVKDFCSAKGNAVDVVFSDICSCQWDKRKGYNKLFNLIINKKVNTIFVEHKNRLFRDYDNDNIFDEFEKLCQSYGTKIVAVENTDAEL
jgi:predicted site-specific integrase-resolvase